MNMSENNSHYIFDTDKNNFPTFTKKNIAFLNGILRYDSNYSASLNKDVPEYADTYAGILESKKEIFFNFPEIPEFNERDELGNRKDLLYKVIESIDIINSTHLASEGNAKNNDRGKNEKRNRGRARVAAKIREIGGKKLKQLLEQGDSNIVSIIADREVGGKHNFSFATKFCSYVSIYALGKDNYCIYDNVIQSVLPYYAYMYIDKDVYEENYSNLYRTSRNGENISLVETYKENDDYKGYRNLIDDIIKGIKANNGVEVTYADFDHMLWYYFKRSKKEREECLKILPARKG